MSRDAILARIRGALKTTEGGGGSATGDYAERSYRTAEALPAEERLALLTDRLRDYGVSVTCTNEAALRDDIASALRAAGVRRIAVPEGLPIQWMPEGFDFQVAEHRTAVDLDRFDGALTGCTLAIAETGTVVLQSAALQGPRRLALVPDHHLCVVYENQIVDTVTQALERLEPTCALPTTFVSGPSATSDIEMTRIKGVHGPRNMAVLIVRGSPDPA